MKNPLTTSLVIFLFLGWSYKKPTPITISLSVDTLHNLIMVKYQNNSDSNYVITEQRVELYDEKNKFIPDYLSPPDPEIKKVKTMGYQNRTLLYSLLDDFARATCIAEKENPNYQASFVMDSCLKGMRRNMTKAIQDSTMNLDFFFIMLPARDSLVFYYTIENRKPHKKYIFKVKHIVNSFEYRYRKIHSVYMTALANFIKPTGFYLYREKIKADSIWIKF